jgi:hypothetical protein
VYRPEIGHTQEEEREIIQLKEKGNKIEELW